ETIFITDRDPSTVLTHLAERGIHHVWLEGGPTLAGAWLDAGVIDRAVGYLAPTFLGAGSAAVNTSATTLSDRHSFHFTSISQIGPDLRVEMTPIGKHDSGKGV